MSAVVRVHTGEAEMQEVELAPVAGAAAPPPASSPQPGAEAAAAAATSSAEESVAASAGGPAAAAGPAHVQQEPSPIQPGAATAVEQVAPAAYLEFLRKFRSVWREQPDLYISWENLSYTVKVPKRDTKVPTLVSGIAHALAKPVKAVAALVAGEHEHSYNILHALAPSSGVIRPGTMTLVLAPPGHGKSTFLKALSGRLSHDSSLKGTVRFNNLTDKENLDRGVHVSRLAAFVGQSDMLFPVLTVDETLRFAANSSLPDPRLLLSDPSLSPEDRVLVEELIAADPQRTDMLIKLLGLEECKQTIVGNDLLRGVSGGQRKRVSLGEMLLCNARAFMLDEVSTGLDAAVTLHIFSALKQVCKINNSSVVVALLQPTPETYGLFDDILLLRDGQTVYHGPRDEVPKWLWEVAGLEVPPGVDEAGFIVDYLSDPRLMYENAAKAHEAALGEHAEHSSVHQPEGLNGKQPGQQPEIAALDLQGRESQRATLSGPVHTPTHVKIHLSPEGGENSRSEGDQHQGNHAPVQQAAEQEQGLLAPPAPVAPSSVVSAPVVDPRQKQLRGAMSSSNMVQYHSTIQGTPVLSSDDLHARYRSSMWAAQGTTEMELAKAKAVPLDPKGWNAYTKAQYAQRFPHGGARHTSLNMSRQFKLTARNKTMVPPRLMQSVIMGLVFGTLFISLPKEKFADRMGLLLYVIMAGAFANLTELPVASEARNVVSKQIDAGFFPSLSYSLSVAIMHIPLTILECLIFGSLMYWLPGFHASAGNYFFYMLVLVLNSNALSVFFRCISYLAKNPDIARQMDMPFIVCFIVFGGFLITYDKIPRWLLFIFYISPFSWGVRSLAQNEFFSSEYDGVSSTGVRFGDEYLAAFGVFLEHIWLWMGVVYLAGFYVVFLFVNAFLLHRIKPITPQGTRKAIVDTKHMPLLAEASPPPQTDEPVDGANGATAAPTAAAAESVIHVASKARRLGGNKASFQLSALPFTPVTLAWRHINYSVEVGTGKEKHSRQLLNDISGYAAPGRMTALMGSSGAGKTTLMDVIAGRKTVGTISGEILVNGFPKEKASFEKLTGYVEQSDVHIGTATVREALLFSAQLRLPLSVSREAREIFVDEVMALVGLTSIAKRLIGDAALPGLSQGQLKLVTIAVELVANPSVIFLDEPTSGLDAPSAARVMKAVRRIAGTGRTVLCTIHQPSEALFLMFDRLLLLKTGGRDVYFSEIGRKGAKLVSYFEEASDYKELLPRGSTTILPNGKKKVQLRISPANWMLDVIGAAGQSENIADYAAIWRKSSLYNNKTLQEIEDASTPAKGSAPLTLTESYASNLTRYSMVQHRSFVSHWRNAPMNLTRVLLMAVFSIVLGIVYLQINTSDFAGVTSQISVIFLAMSFPASICAGSALPTFFRQRAVYYRETTIGLYGPTIFHISNFLVEIPYLIVCTFVFLTPFYFMVGFNSGARQYFAFYLMTFLMCVCYSSLSALWLALFPNQIAANIANGLLMNLFFMFGGLFIKPSSIPIGWKWFHYIDPVPKAFIPVALNQYFCDVNAVGNTCPQIKPSPTEPAEYTYNYLRHLLQQDAGDFSKMVGWLILEIVVIRLFVVIALKKVSHIKR